MRIIISFAVVIHFVNSDSGRGKEIVQNLYQHRTKCKEPSSSGWVALPDGLKCGLTNCDYPNEWCAIRGKQGIPDLYCATLETICQDALKEIESNDPSSKIISNATESGEDEDEPEEEITTARPTVTPVVLKSSNDELESKKAPDCQDRESLCCFWAFHDECERNPTWMKRTCRKSCGACNCILLDSESCPTKVNVGGCRWLLPSQGGTGPARPVNSGKTRIVFPASSPRSRPGPPNISVRQGGTGCQDRQPLCSFWASTGQCGLNRLFMSNNCPASCGLCA